ncbi:hypothetical protein SAMN05216198_2422 [Halopseudomonas litoralis]|uniref:Twin-arginine translocation pathway signal protein n=1 Tax=Halopseudomonas litoralis TaxID=797277 RepID=A0A1H1TYD3_9GAMM|nr:twin-arginine translocation pathway signal protein [Halopseudomonas litoralis]SDS64599.1 hypothetical protein SAMN05216198_2422 [Halopseudomonas litoralis]
MTNIIANAPGLNRRQLLKLGLFGTAVLATAGGIASLSGCAAGSSAPGFQQLREDDLPMLRRVIQTVLAEALPAARRAEGVEGVLLALDNNLNRLSPSLNRQVLQLFDLLTLSVTRGPATGIWGPWENASDESVQAFLKRWENSSFALLQQGQSALTNLILLSCYSSPASWPQCGYPGPPRI